MRTLQRWSDALLAQAERMPLLGELQRNTLKGILRGAIGGLLLFFMIGIIFGGINRGLIGALVGALSGAIMGLVLGAVVGALVGTAQLPQEGQITLGLELENQEGRYAPGDCVRGYVSLSADSTLRIDGGTVYLLCRGFYAHDGPAPNHAQDEPELVRETQQYLAKSAEVIPAGTIHKDATLRYPFNLTIPAEALPSHHGYLCSVRWTVHAVLEAPHLARSETHQELYVEAAPPALPAEQESYQSAANAPFGQLILALSRVVYAEGETLTGRVHLTPSENFEADEIRAMLLRVENTPQGEGYTVYVGQWDPQSGLFQGERRPGGHGTTYVWIEGETRLSSRARFNIGEAVTFPFHVDIPTQWRPTLATEQGRVTWKVGVILARAGYTDTRAFHEVIVHTGAAQVAKVLEPAPRPAAKDSPARLD